MPVLDAINRINKPVYRYRSIKQRATSIIFLIIGIIGIIFGLFMLFFDWKAGGFIIVIGLVLLGFSWLSKMSARRYERFANE